MDKRQKTIYYPILACLVFIVFMGCKGTTEEAVERCAEQARQEQFEAKQAYDACYLEASNRMIEIMNNCDEIAPVNSSEHSQCLREAIAQFRTDVGECVDAHNERIQQAIDNLRDCVRRVANPGGN